MPHRDFDEVYTGGLSYLHAFAFRLFGVRLLAMRYVLFGVFVLWIPAVYYIAARFAAPPLAGLITLSAVAWSIPNYSAAMPSWYNLFFAVFGAAALFRHLETRHARWLVAAGIAGGLSILIKVIGFYFVASGILALAFLEQSDIDRETTRRDSNRLYALLLSAGVGLLSIALVLLVRRAFGLTQVWHFVVPGTVLGALLAWREWRLGPTAFALRLSRISALIGPFLIGVLCCLIPFFMVYFTSGSLDDLLRGMFVAPISRFDYASRVPLHPLTILFVIPVVALILCTPRNRPFQVLYLGFASLPLVLLLTRASEPLYYVTTLAAIWNLTPIVVVGGSLLIAARGRAGMEAKHQPAVILLSILSLCSLVQFPFSAPVYFLYFAPLLLLASLSLLPFRPQATSIFTLLATFYLAFAVVHMTPDFISHDLNPSARIPMNDRLDLPRGGIRIRHEQAAMYGSLIPFVQEKATGDYIYASPDCPEVYFLAGLRNPTRTIFEFLDKDFYEAESVRTHRILSELERTDVHAVVINLRPDFSGPPPLMLQRSLEERFPQAKLIGDFQVRWKP